MSAQKVQIENQLIKDEAGMPLLTMPVPQGWSAKSFRINDKYCGHRFPFMVRVDLMSPDNTCRIRYFTPRIFLDDHLIPHSDGSVDDYGNLMKKTVGIEENIERWKNSQLSAEEATEGILSGSEPFSKEAAWAETNRAKREAAIADNPRKVLNNFYYRAQLQWYDYTYKKTPRKLAVSMIEEADTYEVWRNVPPMILSNFSQPFMKDAAMKRFPNAHFNETVNAWIYLSEFYTGWEIWNLFFMDCQAKDFDELYAKVFKPIASRGVTFDAALNEAFEAARKERAAENAKKRAEKSAEADEKRKLVESRLKDNGQHTKYTQRWSDTQKEIDAMRRDSYEKKRESDRKVREIWSDTIRGDTRFVDRYGDEHVLHTYDNYAYRSGSTYVTSDSPLDHGYDWEELEKKKY